MSDTATHTAGERTFSPEQWQGLANLGDLVSVLYKLLEGPMGGVLTGYVAEGASLLPDGAVGALRETLQMLTDLHEQGVIGQLNTMISLTAQTLTRDNINQFMSSALDMAQDISFTEVLRSAFQEAARESAHETADLGGFGGLLRVMKDKEVQAGLRIMGAMAGKLAPLWQHASSPQPPRPGVK